LRDVGRVNNKRQASVTSGAWRIDVKGRRGLRGQTSKLTFYLQKCHWSFFTSVFPLADIN